ncbi:thioesterase [Rhodococcus ruber Chol-4]|uniref:PaaI family thioesterase n=1 Tax=Rhodococcus TaxID=1827 RepID=UPI000347AEBC|nr:PaaI family thioesterase [Rhodococcus ruber]KXF83703.1 thioesterase [Rhodococcus ruber Chol-4]MDO2378457.1 PaaI family thioesterase [Rhodococcus ruber]
MRAIQHYYPQRFAHCFGCGPANPDGMRLESFLDGDETVARYTPGPAYSGGVPGHVYGGLIASLLDCHGAASASAFAQHARGRAIGDDREPLRFVTGTLTVEYRRPTPMGVELTVRGRLKSHEGRKVIVGLELAAGDDVCACGEMIAIEIPPTV